MYFFYDKNMIFCQESSIDKQLKIEKEILNSIKPLGCAILCQKNCYYSFFGDT